MTEENNPAPEAGDSVLPDEAGLTLQTEQPAPEKAEKPAPDDDKGQDDTPPAEDDDSPDDEAKKTPSKERRERRKAYIEQLKAEKRKAEDQLGRLKRATEGEEEPKEDDFSDLTEYTIAKAAWAMTKKQAARESAAVEEAANGYDQQRRRELLDGFNDAKEEARRTIADYDKVVENPNVFIAPHVAELILESDTSAELAYAIASKPAEARRISQMEPLAAAREIGRLEASLSQPKPRTQTSAPEPIRPVNARGASSRSPESMSYAEYKKARAAGTI